jgi:hypothetical protein
LVQSIHDYVEFQQIILYKMFNYRFGSQPI